MASARFSLAFLRRRVKICWLLMIAGLIFVITASRCAEMEFVILAKKAGVQIAAEAHAIIMDTATHGKIQCHVRIAERAQSAEMDCVTPEKKVGVQIVRFENNLNLGY